MTKKILMRGLGLLALVALLLYGGFYYKWFWPDKDVPSISGFTGESRTGESFGNLENSFEEALATYQKTLKVPAISAAIYVDGEFAWAGANGYADIKTATQVTTSHKFRLGSTSKIFTAGLAYKMEEQGLVDTSLPISTYIKDLPENYRSLTLKQLLSHTAGVRNYGPNYTTLPPHEGFIDDQYSSATEALEVFLSDPLNFKPGEKFMYSAWGFVLASVVLEQAGGKDFPALLEEVIFHPMGLEDSMAEFSGRTIDPGVSYYLTQEGRYTLEKPVNTSVKWAAGGLVSTPDDVARFGSMLLAGDILSETSLEALWTPVLLADGTVNEQNYGQGFRIDTSKRLFGEDRPALIYHHGGLVSGGSSFMMIVPEYGISVSVQINSQEVSARTGAQDLAYELVRIAAGATTSASASTDFLNREYIRAALQGNLQGMEDTLAAKTETENDRLLLEKFRARFIERVDGLDLAREDPLVAKIGAQMQEYWRAALLDPASRDRLENKLKKSVGAILQEEGIQLSDKFFQNPDEFLTKLFEERGYFSIFGRTTPLLEFMVWKTTNRKIHQIELTDGLFEIEVNYLGDFISMGWSSFATFGGPSTGGWATDQGLYIVTDKWDLDSEAFKISYLKHEGRHFADYGLYPNLEQPDLEYRAKLTELAFAKESIYDLLGMFTNHAARVDNSPHALANWHVITDISKALLATDWPENPDVWKASTVEEIQSAAKRLLEKHSMRLNTLGAETTTGTIAY